MRRVLILLAVLGLVYAAVLGFGVASQEQGDQQQEPPGFVQVLAWLAEPFAPRLPFPDTTVAVAAAAPYRWAIPFSDDPVRVVRFTLQSGLLAEFRVCPPNSLTSCNVRAVCAVPQGTPLPQGSCGSGSKPGPSVTVSARKEDGTLWISAPQGPVILRRD
jgi:hypothetical protein